MNSDAASVCHRCERVDQGGVWLTVRQFGAYAQTWEFCSIECLGRSFEDPNLIAERDRLAALVAEYERFRLCAGLPGPNPPEGYFDV